MEKRKFGENSMNSGRVLFLFLFVFMLNISFASFVVAESDVLDIYVFVGETCPHCTEMESFLDSLKEDYDYINPIYYEVWYDKENQKLFQEMADLHNIQIKGVPTAFIGNKNFVGYSSQMNDEIISAIEENSKKNLDNYSSNNSSVLEDDKIKLPIIGEIDSSSVSLPVLTVLLGFLDGFNPCAFFVLLFLLSMLVYAKSKKRMLIIGLTFVFFSGLIYFLFMSAWLNFFMVTQNITIVTTVAGVVALGIAGINIKDFFAFKKGVSLSVSDKHKKNLISRMRSLLKAESMTSMMIGTITLAVAANMYELLCTAGFPMVFTKILVLNQLETFNYYSYLFFYNIVYIIPLLTIVLVFTYTFGAKKLSQSQGESLKLLSGMMMLSLGSMLVFAPSLLNNVFAAVGTILLALTITGLILFVKKKVKKEKEVEGNEIQKL